LNTLVDLTHYHPPKNSDCSFAYSSVRKRTNLETLNSASGHRFNDEMWLR